MVNGNEINRKEKMKKGTINQCIITLTRNCNLRCKFCYAKGTGYIENDFIEYDDLKRIVDFCNDIEINDIVFSGGEPSLYPNLIDILKYIRSRKRVMSVSMSTNGIRLANYAYCKQLVDNGIKYIDISIKGKDEHECLKMAGHDCLESQLNAIRNLSGLPVILTCSMVLTNDNVYGVCDTIKRAYDCGARQFSFSFALDNQKSVESDLQYLKRHNPFPVIDAFVAQIDQLDVITEGQWWIEYTFPLCVYTREQLLLLEGRLASPCQIFNGLGITLDTKKNLIPCSMYFENAIGQYGQDFSSVDEFELWVEQESYKSTIDNLNKLPSTDCLSCELLERCNGGCPIFWKNCSFEAFKIFREQYR